MHYDMGSILGNQLAHEWYPQYRGSQKGKIRQSRSQTDYAIYSARYDQTSGDAIS